MIETDYQQLDMFNCHIYSAGGVQNGGVTSYMCKCYIYFIIKLF